MKKKEQELKVIVYRAVSEKIAEKRGRQEYDTDMMDLTKKILTSNPDVYTLWNIRKECVLKFRDNPNLPTDAYDRELHFTEMCLQVNPKSYGAWYHRYWVLENSPEPNWQHEVDLCTRYLKYDERNFHCWDYRRVVTERAKIPSASELDFCTEKIEKNFSNYSSWHNRSKLLPALFPHETDKSRPISETRLKEELELVLTAAFTDPNDSSAWFYQRWLLGYSAPQLDIAVFKMIHHFVIITFTVPINLGRNFRVTTNFLKDGQLDAWQPLNESVELNQTWWIENDFEAIKLEPGERLHLIVTNTYDGTEYRIDVKNFNNRWVGLKLPKFEYEFGEAVKQTLKEQLKSCQELLAIEPDSKWTLLTSTLLMRAINSDSGKLSESLCHSKTLDNLKKLQVVDPMRCGYYQDLASKWIIQHKLKEWIRLEKIKDYNAIDLSNASLTSIHYENYLAFFDQIILAKNQLTSRNLAVLETCQLCFELDLLENKIDSYAMFPKMRFLAHVTIDQIKDNYVTDKLRGKCENMVHVKVGSKKEGYLNTTCLSQKDRLDMERDYCA